jgi:zinc transport system ATP-binding protein
MQKAIEVQNLSVKLGNYTALDNVNFSVPAGSLVFLFGANGSGKTTLMKTILGLIQKESGTIKLFGKVQTQKLISEYLGYVPQYNIIDRDFPITVQEMIELECPQKQKCEVGISGHLQYLHSEHLAHKKISELSGGEFQKVLIARALTRDPEVLILDEPTNNLDDKTEAELFRLLDKLNKEYDKTIVIISHDPSLIKFAKSKSPLLFKMKNKKVESVSKNTLFNEH